MAQHVGVASPTVSPSPTMDMYLILHPLLWPFGLFVRFKEFAWSILYHATTVYLFMATDFKTIIIPIVCPAYRGSPLITHVFSQNVFALALTPHPTLRAFLNTQLWLFLHLLQVDVSNQTYSGAEDVANRPWRPLPSGRVTVCQSRRLRWALLPLCFFISLSHGPWALCASATLAWALLVHDDFDWSKHIFLKNFCNTVGYGAFECGASLIMCESTFSLLPIFSLNVLHLIASQTTLDWRTQIVVACSTGIVLSTIFAQDFSDVEGDKRYGRRTVPIIFPSISRLYILLILPLWSIALITIWNTSRLSISLPYIMLGAFVGLRYFQYRSVPADALSYKIYNVRLSLFGC
jgi:4-hydroxybenzoate polyprenyltransferase